MTPIADVYTLSADVKLDRAKVNEVCWLCVCECKAGSSLLLPDSQILALGHSRVPVHSAHRSTDFLGMLSECLLQQLRIALANLILLLRLLVVKTLITYDPHECKTVGSFPLTALPETLPGSTCLDALNYVR